MDDNLHNMNPFQQIFDIFEDMNKIHEQLRPEMDERDMSAREMPRPQLAPHKRYYHEPNDFSKEIPTTSGRVKGPIEKL